MEWKRKFIIDQHKKAMHDKNGTLPNIIFSDEKLITVQQSHNHQNDRILLKSIAAIPGNAGKVFRSQKLASVMVWAAVSKRGKTPLISMLMIIVFSSI